MPLLAVLVEAAGWAGAVVLLLAYARLSAGRVHQSSAAYQWMNLVGAAGLMLNAALHGSWPPAALNLVWAGIAAAALVRRPATR